MIEFQTYSTKDYFLNLIKINLTSDQHKTCCQVIQLARNSSLYKASISAEWNFSDLLEIFQLVYFIRSHMKFSFALFDTLTFIASHSELSGTIACSGCVSNEINVYDLQSRSIRYSFDGVRLSTPGNEGNLDKIRCLVHLS